MTTYAIRKEHYADDDVHFYVYTITPQGIAHHFADNLSETEANYFVAELTKLSPPTVAMLTGKST